MDSFEWTDERLAILRKLSNNGSTNGYIADCLGVEATKYHVATKRAELGLNRSARDTSSARQPGPWEKNGVIQELLALHAQGISRSLIAKALNKKCGTRFSRNAVIGKLCRLGFARDDVKTQVRQSSGPTRKARQKRAPSPAALGNRPAAPRVRIVLEPEPMPPDNPADKVTRTFAALDLDKECRWPIGDPKDNDFGFCGAERMVGSSYCEAHFLRSLSSMVNRPRRPLDDPAPASKILEVA